VDDRAGAALDPQLDRAWAQGSVLPNRGRWNDSPATELAAEVCRALPTRKRPVRVVREWSLPGNRFVDRVHLLVFQRQPDEEGRVAGDQNPTLDGELGGPERVEDERGVSLEGHRRR